MYTYESPSGLSRERTLTKRVLKASKAYTRGCVCVHVNSKMSCKASISTSIMRVGMHGFTGVHILYILPSAIT